MHVAFCPERVVQVLHRRASNCPDGERNDAAVRRTPAKLFGLVAPKVSGSSRWRRNSRNFSTMPTVISVRDDKSVLHDRQLRRRDYQRVLSGMKKIIRGPGTSRRRFCRGSVPFKTRCSCGFSDNQFSLGHSAMTVNEGLVLYLVGQIEKKYELSKLTVGLLAWRSRPTATICALRSVIIKEVLEFRAHKVLTTDPHVSGDDSLLPLKQVIGQKHLLILCVPHEPTKISA